MARPGRQLGKHRDERARSDTRGKIIYQLTKGLFDSSRSLIMPCHCCYLSEDLYVITWSELARDIISGALRKIGSYAIQILIKIAYLLEIRLCIKRRDYTVHTASVITLLGCQRARGLQINSLNDALAILLDSREAATVKNPWPVLKSSHKLALRFHNIAQAGGVVL